MTRTGESQALPGTVLQQCHPRSAQVRALRTMSSRGQRAPHNRQQIAGGGTCFSQADSVERSAILIGANGLRPLDELLGFSGMGGWEPGRRDVRAVE